MFIGKITLDSAETRAGSFEVSIFSIKVKCIDYKFVPAFLSI